MPTKTTGAKTPQKNETKEQANLPIRATINWLNPSNDSNVRATASLTVGGAFTAHGLKVVDGNKGLFVSMPNFKTSKGEYKDIFHAVTADARQQMNEAVLAAYEQKLGEQTHTATDIEADESPGMQGISQ
jgi:stage V sporulation protein G